MIVVIAVMTTEKGRSSRFRSIRVIFFLFLFVFVFATGVANAHLVKYASSDSSIDKASDFNLKTLDGKQITIASFKGKPTVIWFMAAWCPSCIGQTDAIKKVKSEFGDNINILVIDMWSLVDTDRVTIKYGITEVDSTVVVDANGNILLKHLGPSGYQPIKDTISKLSF